MKWRDIKREREEKRRAGELSDRHLACRSGQVIRGRCVCLCVCVVCVHGGGAAGLQLLSEQHSERSELTKREKQRLK